MQGTWSEDLKDGPGRFISDSGSAQQASFSADRLLPGQEEGEHSGNLDASANLLRCFLATKDVVSKRCSFQDCSISMVKSVRVVSLNLNLRYICGTPISRRELLWCRGSQLPNLRDRSSSVFRIGGAVFLADVYQLLARIFSKRVFNPLALTPLVCPWSLFT
jgi:hypothetical protein